MKRYDRNFLVFLQSRAKEPSKDIQIGESSDQREMKSVDENLNEKIPVLNSVQSNPKINCKETTKNDSNLYTDLYRVSIVRTNLDPVKFFHIKLKALLMDPSDSNELIMDRILSEFTSSDLNSKVFCGTLAIVLCKKCLENNSFNTGFFIKRIFLLKKYLNSNEKFELESLSAIRKADSNQGQAKCQKSDNESDFSNLPHEILLKIFKYLNLKTRCRIASVCRSWYQAVYDETLWHHIEIDSFINLKKLWKLVRHRQFQKAKSIRIMGNLNKIDHKNQSTLSSSFMEKLCSTCTSLATFEVKYADMSSIQVNDLPDSISCLKLIRCEIPIGWFKNIYLTNLVHVDLSDSSRICASHVKDLSSCSHNLESLKLSRCYRIDDNLIDVLVQGDFRKLKFLNLEDVPNITSLILE
ncbi:F-box LRR-repeat 12, partial [Brachionus plicatilis]